MREQPCYFRQTTVPSNKRRAPAYWRSILCRPLGNRKKLGDETIGVLLGQNEMSPPIHWWATAAVVLILSASHGC